METKDSLFISAIKSGLIIGAVSIVIFFLMYVADIKPVGFMIPILTGLGSIAISIVLLVIFFKKYRTTNGGFISFRDAFLYCFIALSVSVLLSSLITNLFIFLIEPGYYKSIMDAQKAWMETNWASKMTEEQMTQTLDKLDEQAANMGSFKYILKNLLFSIIGSGIIALIVGAIMKKNPDLFENTSGGVI
jgi:hypothetical protein